MAPRLAPREDRARRRRPGAGDRRRAGRARGGAGPRPARISGGAGRSAAPVRRQASLRDPAAGAVGMAARRRLPAGPAAPDGQRGALPRKRDGRAGCAGVRRHPCRGRDRRALDRCALRGQRVAGRARQRAARLHPRRPGGRGRARGPGGGLRLRQLLHGQCRGRGAGGTGPRRALHHHRRQCLGLELHDQRAAADPSGAGPARHRPAHAATGHRL